MCAHVQGEGLDPNYQVNADGTVERVVTVAKALDPEMLEKVRLTPQLIGMLPDQST
jgi:hypothetical protein